jgi:hypothetical protein
VNECGALKKQTSASSSVSLLLGSTRLFKVSRFGVGSYDLASISVRRIPKESLPLILITPMPLRPGGVDKATIVSIGTATVLMILK